LIGGRAQGQAPVAPPAGAGAPAPATASRTPIPGLNDVVATITVGNQTDKITKGELINFLSRFPLSDENRDAIYRQGVDFVANTKLLTLFLARQKLSIPADKIDENIERLKQRLQSEGQDLATALLQSNSSMDEVRKQIEDRLRWEEFLNLRATDATLRKYVADNRDQFRGTQIRASHIMLKLEPNATDADKEKLKQKLLGIKKEIEGGSISFGAAANKYSEDPANEGGAGGDLDYFSLNTGLVEEFTDAAFKLKKGMISDPVETPFGIHLIQVTDRKEGKDPDFEQNKPYIRSEYAKDLQREVVSAEKKLAKIDIKPMPKDLFRPEAPAAPAVPAAGAEKAKTAGGEAPAPK
jgi:parvulin-like peptidyl-prolyl isomerase